MADLPESSEWTTGVYQLETSDPVLGGPEGVDNLQAKQLANRTRWLKNKLDALVSSVSDKAAKATSLLGYGITDAYTKSETYTRTEINALTDQATESHPGTSRVATQVQVNAGTDDSNFVTSKKLRYGVSYSLEQNGYIAFPSWMGGWVVQWGRAGSSTVGPITIPFPIAFPSSKFFELAMPIIGNPTGWDAATSNGAASINQAVFHRRSGGLDGAGTDSSFYLFWIAAGR